MRLTQSDGPSVQTNGTETTDPAGKTVWLEQVPPDEKADVTVETGPGGVTFAAQHAAVEILGTDSEGNEIVIGGNPGDWLLYDGTRLTVIGDQHKTDNYGGAA